MGLRQNRTEEVFIADRFGIAQDGYIPEDQEERLDAQRRLRANIYDVAKDLVAEVEESRELSLALTKLEEALMWAGKAIFKD